MGQQCRRRTTQHTPSLGETSTPSRQKSRTACNVYYTHELPPPAIRPTNCDVPGCTSQAPSSKRRCSQLVPGMDAHNPINDVGVLHVGETSFAHHVRKHLLLRELADALDEVLVGVAVVGDELPHEGDHVEGVLVVHLPQHGRPHLAELHAQEPPPRLQHPQRVPQRGVGVRDVPQPEGDGVAIHAGVLEGEVLGVALHEGEQPLGDVRLVGALLPHLQHRLVDVAHRHVGLLRGCDRTALRSSDGLEDAEGDVSGTTRDIEMLGPGSRAKHVINQMILPDTMQSSAHNVVHHVVISSHSFEDLQHHVLLFLHSHVLVPETCCCPITQERAPCLKISLRLCA
mmetsp:Transcript_27724/g.60574  ORF Transcript_27724/g.60574 Transcript_27724/m.60574 type:complete len:342 (+) Transcript_27724:144-1169(+)